MNANKFHAVGAMLIGLAMLLTSTFVHVAHAEPNDWIQPPPQSEPPVHDIDMTIERVNHLNYVVRKLNDSLVELHFNIEHVFGNDNSSIQQQLKYITRSIFTH